MLALLAGAGLIIAAAAILHVALALVVGGAALIAIGLYVVDVDKPGGAS